MKVLVVLEDPNFALEFLRVHGEQGPGRGRKAAMRELGRGWRGLQDLCDELTVLQVSIRRLTPTDAP
ncbi:MAG: hypothetical protein FJ265_14235 [Planctomycetes bacterium]|nr:hypothetical protein [Planctomycetota bacterium]